MSCRIPVSRDTLSCFRIRSFIINTSCTYINQDRVTNYHVNSDRTMRVCRYCVHSAAGPGEKITKDGPTRPNSAKTERSVRCVNRENGELRAMKHEQGTSARLPHSGDFPPIKAKGLTLHISLLQVWVLSVTPFTVTPARLPARCWPASLLRPSPSRAATPSAALGRVGGVGSGLDF